MNDMFDIRTYRADFLNSLKGLYEVEEVKSFFNMLSASYLGLSRAQIALVLDRLLTADEMQLMNTAKEQLMQHQPIQYILGETEFYGSVFKVNPHVLIPRPETEELVDWIYNDLQNREQVDQPIRILDIGTGSGCIAISLAKEFPQAEVYALDLSEQAIQVATENAKRNNVSITFIQADITDDALLLPNQFDTIVSNPPYVRMLEKHEIQSNVLDNEPHLALFVEDEDPLIFYRKITKLASGNLTKDGLLYFEINQYLGRETVALVQKLGFEDVELRKDVFTNDRMIRAKR
ncbi:peptide chain release factor N(5)-glutamine methyltransferase [Aquimarina sp. 2-A2]|uniref:peptide chain release factor N(5)-glutamine methyltransferase n=1 Tax=Aquimarina sp. 2-A2 TaxID=3382644 RepID=UPI00387F00D2